MATTSAGGQASGLSSTSSEHALASQVLAKLGASAGSATLHGSSWSGGAESVLSGVGSATLVGGRGVSSISGGSGHHVADRGAFSFDTVSVGGKHLIGSFAGGVHSVTSGAHGGHTKAVGGHSHIALHHGKTVIHIKH